MLEPLIFLMYIYDLLVRICRGYINRFADDPIKIKDPYEISKEASSEN